MSEILLSGFAFQCCHTGEINVSEAGLVRPLAQQLRNKLGQFCTLLVLQPWSEV